MSGRLTEVVSWLKKAEVEIYKASRNHVLISFLSAVVPSCPWFNCDIHEWVYNSPPHKISSSDSGSLSLGFRSPISIGGVLFNLERTTLQRKHDKHQREFIPSVDESDVVVLVWSRFLPADGAIEHAHGEHGEGEVPRVTHGDEHHIVMILKVPLRAMGRVQHKTNLRPKREREQCQDLLSTGHKLLHTFRFTCQNQLPCRRVKVQRSSSRRMLPRWKTSRKATNASPKVA